VLPPDFADKSAKGFFGDEFIPTKNVLQMLPETRNFEKILEHSRNITRKQLNAYVANRFEPVTISVACKNATIDHFTH